MKVNVTRHYTIDWDGSPEDYIRLAHSLTEQGLDSLDMGDATGAIIAFSDRNTNPAELIINYDGTDGVVYHCNVDFDDELFRYDSITGIGTQLTDWELTHVTPDEIRRSDL